jgi:plastocyanin
MKNLVRTRSTLLTRWTLVALACAFLAAGCNSSTSAPTTPDPNCVVGQVPTNPECVNPPNLLTVTIKNGAYSPNPVNVAVGQSVNWLNADSIAHTATDSGVFDTGSIAPTSAADAPVQFNTPGTFNYHCTLHANESATIIVK